MLTLRIALRYLLSRKSHGAVNIISAISLAAIAVAAAAMIVVLSVFNGFTQLAESKLSKIDPDFTLTPTEGKTFECADTICRLAAQIPGVVCAEPELTEQAFAVAGARQMAVTIMGMTPRGIAASGIPSITIDGNSVLSADSMAILSVGVAIELNLRPSADLCRFTLYEPRRIGRVNPANPMGAFIAEDMVAEGVFQVEQEEYDRDVVIVPYSLACTLLARDNCATAADIYLTPEADRRKVRQALSEIAAGADQTLKVSNRLEQQQQAFRMIAIEKWFTFVMLTFILVIASFNIISTLSMLILEKEPNMFILSAMGATRHMINSIFIRQGWLIIIIGGMAGIAVGTLLTLAQQHFGFVTLNAADPSLMAVDAYPVLLKGSDLLVGIASIVAVALLITPVIPLIRRKG